MTCSTPTQAAGGTPNGLITADTPTSDGLRVFPNNAPFKITITTKSLTNFKVHFIFLARPSGAGAFIPAYDFYNSYQHPAGPSQALRACTIDQSMAGPVLSSICERNLTAPSVRDGRPEAIHLTDDFRGHVGRHFGDDHELEGEAEGEGEFWRGRYRRYGGWGRRRRWARFGRIGGFRRFGRFGRIRLLRQLRQQMQPQDQDDGGDEDGDDQNAGG